MYYKFENLEVWKLSRKFVSDIYTVTKDFPQSELFGLVSQLRRAATSIMLNIAEGSDRKSDIDFRRFLVMSLASLEEVIAALYISLDQNLINKQQFTTLYEDSHKLAMKIKALINFLSK